MNGKKAKKLRRLVKNLGDYHATQGVPQGLVPATQRKLLGIKLPPDFRPDRLVRLQVLGPNPWLTELALKHGVWHPGQMVYHPNSRRGFYRRIKRVAKGLFVPVAKVPA